MLSLVSCGTQKDETPPVITAAEEDLHLTSASRTVDIADKLGITATDDVDGDITAKLSVDTSSVNFDEPGKYTVTATVSDAAGNTTTKKITVTIDVKPSEFAHALDMELKNILRESDASHIKPILLQYDRADKTYYWDVYDNSINETLLPPLSASDLADLKQYLAEIYCDVLTEEIMHYFDTYNIPDPLVIRIFNDAKASSLLFRIEKGKITEDNVGLDRKNTGFDRVQVYDDDNVTITFLTINAEGVVFEVDNKTDRNLTIQADSVSINGVSTDDIVMSDDVAPQSIGKVIARIGQKNILEALELDSIAGQLRVIDFASRDWDTYDALFDIKINDSPGYYDKEFDNLLFTDGNVDIYYWGIDEEAVYFLVRNKTGINITVQADSISINRRSVNDIVMSSDVAPHSVAIINALCEPEYEGAVQTVGGQLRIIDFADRNWSSYDASFVNVEVKP